MVANLTITKQVHFIRCRRGRREIRIGPKPIPQRTLDGRVPRISRLMALALHFDHLIRMGSIENQSELAEIGHVTRARVTQIMNFLHLAPDIQEDILFLPRTQKGHDPIRESHIRPIAALIDWDIQRLKWREIVAATSPDSMSSAT